jgi:hypothetical protein
MVTADCNNDDKYQLTDLTSGGICHGRSYPGNQIKHRSPRSTTCPVHPSHSDPDPASARCRCAGGWWRLRRVTVILLYAILIGLLACALRGWSGGKRLAVPEYKWVWLLPAAVFPQLVVFQLPGTKHVFPDVLAPTILVGSQIVLLVFILVNRTKPGFLVLGVGLALNLAVILLNGGLMPISPETVARLAPNAPPDSWHIGERLGTGKDIVLALEQTRLWFLSDRFLLRDGIASQAALSLGDILIALGVVWTLWCTAGKKEDRVEYRSQRSMT